MLETAILKLADAIVYHANLTTGQKAGPADVIQTAVESTTAALPKTKTTPAAERAKVIEQVDAQVEEAPVEAVEMTKEEAAAFNKEVLQPLARKFTTKFPNTLKTLWPRFKHNGVVPVSLINQPSLHPVMFQAFYDLLSKAEATGKLED